MIEIKAIEFIDISVKYDSLEVLKDINLTIYENEFLGIIGPNGGGKTTFLKAILGLVKPEKGEILVYGKSNLENLKLIGYVTQHLVFDRNYPISVNDVVAMGTVGKAELTKRRKIMELVDEALEKVDMSDYKNKLFGRLSGGERQRVLIARALVAKPKILLLDEATANIDIMASRGFYEFLKELNESLTIILVSHDMGVISNYVKKIACLNRSIFYHDAKEITEEMLSETYQCPVDLIAHGVPHRVFVEHK